MAAPIPTFTLPDPPPPSPPPADPAQEDIITLDFLDIGKSMSAWTSYHFHADFMTPNASWSFECSDANYFELFKLIQNGQRIALKINGTVCATGYVDQVNITSSRTGGTTMQVMGRDALGPLCDSCMDPNFKFDGLQKCRDVIMKLIQPFGFDEFEVSSLKDLSKLTGTSTILSTDDTGKKIITKNIDSPMNSKFKPHTGEGIYEFCERLGRRFGYHMWAGINGHRIVIGQPIFNSKPLYTIIHSNNATTDNNKNLAIESSVSYDWTKQPSVIIAEGHGAGGHFRKQSLKVMMVNELLGDTDSDVVKALKKQYPEAKVLPRRAYLKKPDKVVAVTKFAKPVFLYDDESKTKEQLSNYVRRAMAEHQSKFLVATYVVNRHSQINKQGQKAVWTPNTIVNVQDSVNGINQLMWIKSRTFSKDRSGGTKTTIECILPYTLELSPTE